jgi:hypothetical protein
MARRLSPQNPLDNLKKEAKRWLKALRAGSTDAQGRLKSVHPNAPADPGLRDVQHALAREYGYDGWNRLKQVLEEQSAGKPPGDETTVPAASPQVRRYERLAGDLVLAYEAGDAAALNRLNEHYGRSFTWEDLRAHVWRLVYAVRQAKGRKGAFDLSQAQMLMAREAGFNNWTAFMQAIVNRTPPPGQPYAIDAKVITIAPRRNLTAGEWEILIGVIKDMRIQALQANGQMTNALLERIAQLDHVTSLSLSGSRHLTDEGLKHLARMPQLQHLKLSEHPGGKLTDRGLEVLRQLRGLRTFEMTWQAGISDAGVANLGCCEHLESVDLMGTPTGDGAIRALAGKPKLRHFKSGRRVTDTGLALLHQFPMFKKWQGGEMALSLMGAERGPTHLLLDGPFTDAGLTRLAGLEGVFALTFFWHVSGMTAGGLRVLKELPNLGFLGCEGALCDDGAMRQIAALQRLRMLIAQGTVAGDDGFAALSRSKSIEFIWGRECPNLTGRGFTALSRMPALRGLGVSCKNVNDDAVATLPHFPALKELMPMDVKDDGFRHVGRCEQLDSLWFMYCRDTTDVATEHIAGLRGLKMYYAGKTQITDRSLEILGGMSSLERLEFYECNSITDAGLVFLSTLPRLREVALHGQPHVTFEGTAVFPARVRVDYSA